MSSQATNPTSPPTSACRPGQGARVIPLRPAAPAAPVEPAPKEPLWRDLVGAVLRRERLAQERTLKDVADAARISVPYLSEVERGRKEASSEVLAAAAQALGLGLGDLLGRTYHELTAGTRRARDRGHGTGTASVASAPRASVAYVGTAPHGGGPHQARLSLAA